MAKGQQNRGERGIDKAERERYRMKVYNTIPYFNDRPTYKDGWFVSSSTSVPAKNAIIVDTLIRVWGWQRGDNDFVVEEETSQQSL